MESTLHKLKKLSNSDKKIPKHVMEKVNELLLMHSRQLDLLEQMKEAIRERQKAIYASVHPKQIPGTIEFSRSFHRHMQKVRSDAAVSNTTDAHTESKIDK